MEDCLDKVLDAIDIETFFICRDEEEGKTLAIRLLENFGLRDNDIVFIEHQGTGVRVRARGYIHRAGDRYGWLQGGNKDE